MVYAGFWKRFAALLIDVMILLVPSMMIHFVVPMVGWAIVGILYRVVFESSSVMGTPGKLMMGIAVVDERGQAISVKASLIRYFISFLSGAFMCAGYFMSLFTEKKQTFHDLLASTYVIEKTPPVSVAWFDVWLAQFKKIVGMVETATASAPSPAEKKSLETLETLHKLYQQGALTEAEYLQKKQEILGQI